MAAKCKFCRKRIVWLEVPEEGLGGTRLVFRPFNPRKRASGPYKPHDCQKAEAPRVGVQRDLPDPWWDR